ncbi:MAG: protease inhibitor I42 family protein [Phycisphaerales bacterium]|nr:protease inhibitor I42 family protein [Phycisphaerales bacterium]
MNRVITLDGGPASARKSTTMQEDATLTVRLPTTAGSIYAWRLIDEAGSNLTLAYRVTENDSATNHLHGDRTAWDVFTFVASKPGHARLRFAYDRPWDTETPPLKQFALDVHVAE